MRLLKIIIQLQKISELKNSVEQLQKEIYDIIKYKDDTYKRFSNVLKDIDKNKEIIDNTNRKFTDYETVLVNSFKKVKNLSICYYYVMKIKNVLK